MENKKAVVLLSTYNGEEYIGEQLKSLLAQTYKNLEIRIRDDGSTDKTVEVIQSFHSDKIYLETGKNMGYPEGFFQLLQKNVEGDYFFFCDQDDKWYEDKVVRAVSALEKEGNEQPVLYASAFDYCDEKLNFLRKSDRVKIGWELKDVCYQCLTWGFTMAMNRCARDMMMSNLPPSKGAKDSWLLLICTAMGKVIYDEKSTASYRRHKETTSFGGSGSFGLLKYRIKRFWKGGALEKRRKMLEEFEALFGQRLDTVDRKMIQLFVNKERRRSTQLAKCFYPHRLRSTVWDEFQLRLMFLLGKI